MKRELARKAIHVSSAVLPLGVWLTGRAAALYVLLPLAAVALTTDVARHRVRGFRYHFLRRTRTLLRHHERHGLAGATWMAVAYAAAVILYPTPVAVAAMLFNGVGDAAAALAGKRWGRHRTSWGKSWEGFAAGAAANVAVGLAVALLSRGMHPAAVIVGAVIAAALEFAPLPLDDNVRITLGGGAVLFLATAWI